MNAMVQWHPEPRPFKVDMNIPPKVVMRRARFHTRKYRHNWGQWQWTDGKWWCTCPRCGAYLVTYRASEHTWSWVGFSHDVRCRRRKEKT